MSTQPPVLLVPGLFPEDKLTVARHLPQTPFNAEVEASVELYLIRSVHWRHVIKRNIEFVKVMHLRVNSTYHMALKSYANYIMRSL